MKLLEINLPQYTAEQEPDIDEVSEIVDGMIDREFVGRPIVVRGIASSEHPSKTIDELIDIIATTGSDRYDPARAGDRYENVEGKHIDFFGVTKAASQNSEAFRMIAWGFYHSAKEIHGYPMRIDILIIYDAEQLDRILHRYEGRDDVKDDGFAFKDPAHKQQSVLGIIKIS